MKFIPSGDSAWEQDRRKLLEIGEIERRLAEAGLSIPRTSRFDVYRQAAQGMATRDVAKMPSSLLGLNLMTELREISLILQEMPRLPQTIGWQSKMRTALKGNVLSADDGPDSAGRDAQYELFLASAFRAAGFEVALDEPDVTFQMDGQTFGIAAKRIKSDKAVEKRVREASKQIYRSGHPGIIALDITYLCDSVKPIMANSTDVVHVFGKRLADEFAMNTVNRMLSGGWLSANLTFGLMVCVNTRVTVMESLAPKLRMPIVAPKSVVGFRWTIVGLPSGEPNIILERITAIRDRLSLVAF